MSENKLYRLEWLSMKNYRCYDDKEHYLNLGRKVTVFIGENGCGKTAVLTAIKKGISFILSRDRRSKVNFLGDGKDIKDSSFKVKDSRYKFDIMSNEDYHYPVEVKCKGLIYGQEQRWTYIKPDKRTPVDKKAFRDSLDYFLSKYNENIGEQINELPLLCYFSDSYPHDRTAMTKYEKDIIGNKQGFIERRAGYYHWDSPTTDFYFWKDLIVGAIKRLDDSSRGFSQTVKAIQNSKQDTKDGNLLTKRMANLLLDKEAVDFVKNSLRKFTKHFPTMDNMGFEISDFTQHTYMNDSSKLQDTLELIFSDGSTCLFEMLPEGYKRLMAIALEIACRYVVLNRAKSFLYKTASPRGIVIIDELELHLHPTLAQEALIRLTRTFPDVQFIISTHSPAIVSNIYNDGAENVVYKLTSDHNFKRARNSFGETYDDTLVNTMGSFGRLHLLELYRQLYLNYRQDNDERGINRVKDKLKEFYVNAPDAEELVKSLTKEWDELL